jgi:hypothetical protein
MEIFKNIKESNGLYLISNLGNVKSYTQKKQGEILIPVVQSSGYTTVTLHGDIRKTCVIHRLVAQAFIPNTENKREVNHINGIKNDNRVENLEWATSSENRIHAFRTGLQKGFSVKGKDHPLSKPVTQLTLDNIIVANFAGVREASRHIGVYHGGIYSCCSGLQKTAYGFKWQFSI